MSLLLFLGVLETNGDDTDGVCSSSLMLGCFLFSVEKELAAAAAAEEEDDSSGTGSNISLLEDERNIIVVVIIMSLLRLILRRVDIPVVSWSCEFVSVVEADEACRCSSTVVRCCSEDDVDSDGIDGIENGITFAGSCNSNNSIIHANGTDMVVLLVVEVDRK